MSPVPSTAGLRLLAEHDGITTYNWANGVTWLILSLMCRTVIRITLRTVVSLQGLSASLWILEKSLSDWNTFIFLRVWLKCMTPLKTMHLWASVVCIKMSSVLPTNYPGLSNYNYHMKYFWIFVTFCDVLWNKWQWTGRKRAGIHEHNLCELVGSRWGTIFWLHNVGHLLDWSCIQSAACSQNFRWHFVNSYEQTLIQ